LPWVVVRLTVVMGLLLQTWSGAGTLMPGNLPGLAFPSVDTAD